MMLDLKDERIRPLEYTNYVIQAFPHSEGILWVNGTCIAEISFAWHEYREQPSGMPWPFLEITKRINDSSGAVHSTTSFGEARLLFPQIHGSDVVTQEAFRRLAKEHGVEALTSAVQFYSDSRELLYFNYCEDRWPSLETKIASHFDKHTGGKMRLLRVDCWLFLEFEISYLDDRIRDEFLGLNESLFAEAKLDYWTTRSHAREPSEFEELYWREPFPGSPLPIVFSRCDQSGTPQQNVEFIPEQWSHQRARRMVLEYTEQTVNHE